MKQPKENSSIDLDLAGSIAGPLPDNRDHIIIRVIDPIVKVIALSIGISVGVVITFFIAALSSGNATSKSKPKKKKKIKKDSIELIDHAINNFDDQIL